MKIFLILTFLALAVGYSTAAYAVTMDFAHIGNAGNAADPATGYGAVADTYRISKTKVTNEQYAEFLNAVAATDTYGLYNSNMGNSSMGRQTYGGITQGGTSGGYTYAVKSDAGSYTYANKPVIFVSWYDSIRFTNWLHNGQGAGDTETGAYTLDGGTATPSNGLSVTRNTDAVYWLPSEDEWYKAAYHDASAGTAGTYFKYATGTDIAPDNNPPTSDSGNSANHYDRGYTTGDGGHPYTDVGAYGLSASTYDTYDQNGNVWEWNETLVQSFSRGLRGGSSYDSTRGLAASYRNGGNPAYGHFTFGFRVATVPEPSSLLLLVGLAGGMLVRRSR